MNTLIGIVTFGNLPFTQLTLRSIAETTKSNVDIFVVVGAPRDQATVEWLHETQSSPDKSPKLKFVWHAEANMGFPVSLNEIYEYAWVKNNYDNVIIAGNDIVPYPGAIDALIYEAQKSGWEMVCSSEFDVKSLVSRYPETAQYFAGPNYDFTDFELRPWESHKGITPPGILPNCFKDIRNLCLFKRSVFDKLGYADANFYPGGYFEDNDYCRRAKLSGIRACGLVHSVYFHFWSRTIHQVKKTTEENGKNHHQYFRANRDYYSKKWGGMFGSETTATPFGGRKYCLAPGVNLPTSLRIESRGSEAEIVKYWKER